MTPQRAPSHHPPPWIQTQHSDAPNHRACMPKSPHLRSLCCCHHCKPNAELSYGFINSRLEKVLPGSRPKPKEELATSSTKPPAHGLKPSARIWAQSLMRTFFQRPSAFGTTQHPGWDVPPQLSSTIECPQPQEKTRRTVRPSEMFMMEEGSPWRNGAGVTSPQERQYRLSSWGTKKA